MFHVKHNSPHVLLINPWITDFAAYNFWVRPLGLINIARGLRKNGFRVTLIDCLDFLIRTKKYGNGKFLKTRIEKPFSLKPIPRNYSRYGIPVEMLLKRFSMIEEKPNIIGITSGMTYWYPGVFKVVEITKKFFKNVPIILGGIYATLCYEHANKHSGVEIVFNGREESEVLKLICRLTGFEVAPNSERITCSIRLSTFIPNSIISASLLPKDARSNVPIVPLLFYQTVLLEEIL
jgi:hypothetical protein